MSSSIPSWHILTAHAQPFRGARDLAFCLKVPLDSLLLWASSEGSGETARMRRLAWTFAARIGDKYRIRLARSIFFNPYLVVPYCYLFLLSVFTLWFTYYVSDIFLVSLGSWMTTCLWKSCSFVLPRMPFVNCCQFMYLVISLFVLRAGYGVWLCRFLIIVYLFT